MSDYNNLLTNDQLLKENNRLLDIIAHKDGMTEFRDVEWCNANF